MSDFTNEYWSWGIAIISLLSIFWCILIAKTNSKRGEQETNEVTGHVWDGDLQEYNNPLPRWWLIMFYLTCVFALVYLALYPGLGSYKGLLNWTQTSQYEAEMEQAQQEYGPLFAKYASTDLGELSRDKTAMETGARLFLNYCSVCHGADARGAVGFPNLRDDDWLYGGKTDQIKASILTGRKGMMPAWGAVLGDEGVDNMTQFLLSMSEREHDVNKAEKGKVKYGQLCIACHGPTGMGNPALGAPNLADRIWLYGGSSKSIIHSITQGRNGNMPAHQEFLGEEKSHLLAAYVYSFTADLEQK